HDKFSAHPTPHDVSPEAPFSTRFFTVTVNESDTILAIDTGKIAATSTAAAGEYAQRVVASGKKRGYEGVYKFEVAEIASGRMVIFVDCSRELSMFHSFLFNTAAISIIGLSAIFILVLILSKRLLRPVVESYEKQKQFITDAGHELKTPLAVIAADTEVVEIESGQSEWTQSIKKETARLAQLTTNLVTLARMDETGAKVEMEDFSLSSAVMECAAPFAKLAATRSKKLVFSIEDNIICHGDESMVRRLIGILLDNAVKYSVSGNIVISLKRSGKRSRIDVTNYADNLRRGRMDELFERFYRADTSRNSMTGGSGIGLSIAKAIVEQHGGKISAESPDGKQIILSVII
ncbi:MAG: HAMP domain-containing sensor histidine kinase, partial [Clostridia bacterium]